jgi:DNA-binding CsgD family transcriptional regulator
MSSELIEELSENTRLSKREAQTAVCRAKGMTYQEIADEYDIDRGSVEGYEKRARRKAKQASETVERLEEIGFMD